MSDLLPCPFCGSADVVLVYRGGDGYPSVRCAACRALGPADEDSARAAGLWNRRTPDVRMARAAVLAERERCAKIVADHDPWDEYRTDPDTGEERCVSPRWDGVRPALVDLIRAEPREESPDA